MMPVEFRTAIGGTVKDVDETKRQVLVEFPHEQVDTFRTTFGPDCFRASFATRPPAVCWQHDMKEPIGRTISAQVTHLANELIGQLSDFDAVPLARRAFTQIRDGSLTDTSFGFVRESDEPHPEHRGVTRITKALMHEWSPVTVGSIPGARVVGTRAESQGELTVPDLDEILRLRAAELITPEQAQAALAKLPEWREVITITPPATRDDPGVPAPDASGAGEDTSDAAELAAAVDAALDEAVGWFAKVDISSLPDEVQQAAALVQAAGVVVDDLLDVMGVDDPDDTDDASGEGRASLTVSTKPWSKFTEADYTPAQWKAACLIDTDKGAEEEKDRYALPVREPDGTVNKNALAAAAARLGQVKGISDADRTKAAKALLSLYGQAGLHAPGSLLSASQRSIEPPKPETGDLDVIFAKHRVA